MNLKGCEEVRVKFAKKPVDNEEPDREAWSCCRHAPNLIPLLSVTGDWASLQRVPGVPPLRNIRMNNNVDYFCSSLGITEILCLVLMP